MQKTENERITTEHWEEYKNTRDTDLRNRILMSYLNVVTCNAKKMSAAYKNFADTQDIVNEGVIALMDCIDKYDYTRGVQFDSFASIRVRGAIIDYIRKQDWIPRSARKKSTEIGNAYAELQGKLGRQATDSEVAEFLGMDVDALNKTVLQVYSAAVFSFEELLQENASVFGEDKASKTPEHEFGKKELRQILLKSIDKLGSKERTVVSLYYYEGFKLMEIASVMGLTASRVSQLHSKAMIKLRAMLGKELIN